MLRWTPRFDYDTGPTVLAATIPSRIWLPRSADVGGADRAATGLGASYNIRTDRLLIVRYRFRQGETEAVETFVDYGKAWPNTFTFYPDQSDLLTTFEVDLDSPQMGEDFAPQPDDEFQPARFIDLTLRKVDGTRWSLDWFS